MASALQGLAILARVESAADRAARLWGAAETALRSTGATLAPTERPEAERERKSPKKVGHCGTLDPAATGFHAVISGHSHRPSIEMREGVLFVNPGSAGPRRFKLPVSVGCLTVYGTSIKPRLVELNLGGTT